MQKKWLAWLSGMVLLGTGFFLGHSAQASGSSPGSSADPLVTQSYVQAAITQLKSQIQSEVKTASTTSTTTSQAPTLKVVGLSPGQKLVAQAGDSIIVRVGKAIVQASPLGGLSDVTLGKDLQQGQTAPLNDLLIVPRSDGRGVIAKTQVILLVEGPYSIQ